MKVSREKLQQIIQEELQQMLDEGEVEEGVFDRIGARVGAGIAGAKGAVQRGATAATGAVKQGAMGLAQKGLGAFGATNAAAEIGAAKQQAALDAQQSIEKNKALTAAKQSSIKVTQAIAPKVAGIEKDLSILFKDPQFASQQPAVAKALQILKQFIKNTQEEAAMGLDIGNTNQQKVYTK